MKFYYTPYNMRRVLLDFSPELMAEGAEWYLSENPIIEKKNGNNDPKEFWILPNGMQMNLSGDKTQAELLYYHLSHKGESANAPRITAELCLDKTHGTMVRTWCNCQSFRENYCSCRHIAALAFRYLEDEQEEFRGSEIEACLKERTKVADPLTPGRLRKTSAGLAELLKKRKSIRPTQQAKPAWQTGERRAAAELLTLDVYASVINDSLAVELRAGSSKTYQIKNLAVFLDACEMDQVYDFSGATHLPAGMLHFSPEAQRILTYLIRLKKARLRKPNGTTSGYHYDSYMSYRMNYTSLSSAQQDKLMLLTDRDLDQFMELMEGQYILLSQRSSKAAPHLVDLATEPAPIRMEKNAYGADIFMEEEKPLICGYERMYLVQGEKILALPAENWETRRELASLFTGRKELYISDKNLPAMVASVYELGGEKQKHALTDFEVYLPRREDPQIHIYLDYPQENMITCQMKASYPQNGKIYDLFQQKQGRNIRNFQAEQAAGEAVWSYFDAWNEELGELAADCSDDRLFVFLSETIPALAQYGEVLVSDRLKRLRITSSFTINVGVQVDAGSLLMSLHSNEISDEEIIEVLSNYNRRKKFTRLKNGSFLATDESNAAMLESLAETFRAYGQKNPEAMRIPLFRALYIEEMLADRDKVQLEAGADYLKLLRRIKQQEGNDHRIPEALDGVLRPYQMDGYRWICMLKENGFGGILADDMGLGKTLQVLAYLTTVQGPTLIVAPASLVYNWQKEIRTFTPGLSCCVLAGSLKERKLILEGLRHSQKTGDGVYDIYLTSYDLLKRDIKEYEGIHFENQIIDEAQYIKNQSTQAAKAVRLIDSGFRMALTGTPIENRLSELWSIFDYIMPGFLYNYSRFREDYETPVVANHDQEVMNRLRRMVHPFILRRLKKEVLKDLPDKLEEDVAIRLEGEQRKVYDAYAKRLKLYLDKQSDAQYHQSKLEILSELTKLRQICCGPELFLENYKGHNAKLEACMELIWRSIDGGHKLLLFSQYTRVLDQLGERLKKEKIACYRIDGSTPKEERMKLVEAFQNEKDTTPVFCISLKAGGTGLNLTAADIVIHYDPWWNLAAQNQATDRTHRIGQTNMVTVYNLIAEDTIEEQITLLQKTKARLAEDVLSGEGIGSILIHKDDLMALL